MKSILFICLLLPAVSVKAQQKPALFAAYPETIGCTAAHFDAVMQKPVNSEVILSFPGNFTFRAIVQSSVQKYANLKTVVLRSVNFPGAVFTLSKLSDAYTPEHYTGSIISMQHSDAFELDFEGGIYTLRKKPLHHLIPGCPPH
jgi:hypothetical protein